MGLGLEKPTGHSRLERHETVVMVTFVEENLALLKNVPLCCPQCKGNLSKKRRPLFVMFAKSVFPLSRASRIFEFSVIPISVLRTIIKGAG
jgi:hypothetical protein